MAHVRDRLDADADKAGDVASADRLSVVYVSHARDAVGGAERVLLHSMEAAAGLGCRVLLAAPNGPLVARASGFVERTFNVASPQLLRTRRPALIVTALIDFVRAFGQFVRLLSGTRAAIVHANSGVAALTLCLPCVLLRQPLVWHQHDIVPPRRVNRLMLGLLGRRCAAVLGCSQAVVDSLRRLGIPSERLHVMVNTVRPEFLAEPVAREVARQALGVGQGEFVVSVVGRIVPRKGQDILLRAAILLARQGIRVQCLIVGDVPPGPTAESANGAYLRELQDLARMPELAGRVSFLGYRDDVRALFAASDVVAVPSHAEPLGLVILEAFASSVPVVATAAGGPLELIVNGRTGLLVSPRDPESMAAAIRELHDTPELRRRIAVAALEYVRVSHSPERLGRDLMALYARILRPGEQRMSPAGSVGERCL